MLVLNNNGIQMLAIYTVKYKDYGTAKNET